MGSGCGYESVDRQDGEWKGEEEEVEEGEDIPVAKAIGMYVRGWDGGDKGTLEHEPPKKSGKKVSFADRNQVITFTPVQDEEREVETMSGF